jgi:hypothetical protein
MKKAKNRLAIEQSDRYVIPLSGRPVSRCYVDFGFGLLFFEDGPKTEIRIEGKMKLRSKTGEDESQAGDWLTLPPFLGLFGQSVAKAFALKDGTLEIQFVSGSRLVVEPDEKFEPWELAGDDGLKIVSLPGGELALWQPRQESE